MRGSTIVFTESAELYDAIYFTVKDYAGEAGQIATLLRSTHPACRAVLDIACGTGEHARLLASVHGYDVDGIDLNTEFLRLARLKHPAGRFTAADMADFHLGRRFDAVLCMFSSIGYLLTLDRITQALRCFAEHLAPGGVAIVEPWFGPGDMQPGHHSTHEAEAGGIRVVRSATTEIDGRVSRLRFDYAIEGPDGVRRTTELHELGLFTVAEMLEAFEAAGLDAKHDRNGLTGRGLYVARAGA